MSRHLTHSAAMNAAEDAYAMRDTPAAPYVIPPMPLASKLICAAIALAMGLVMGGILG